MALKEGKCFCWIAVRKPSMISRRSGKDGAGTEGPEAVRAGRGGVPLHALNVCVHCAFFTSGLAMSSKLNVKLCVRTCACVRVDRHIYPGRRKTQSFHQIFKGALDPQNAQNNWAYSFSLNKHCWLLYSGAVLCWFALLDPLSSYWASRNSYPQILVLPFGATPGKSNPSFIFLNGNSFLCVLNFPWYKLGCKKKSLIFFMPLKILMESANILIFWKVCKFSYQKLKCSRFFLKTHVRNVHVP